MGTPLAKPGPTIGWIGAGTGATVTTGGAAVDASGADGAIVVSEGAGLAREAGAR